MSRLMPMPDNSASQATIYVACCKQFADEESTRAASHMRAGGADPKRTEQVRLLVSNAVRQECLTNIRDNNIVAMNRHEHRMYPNKGANALWRKNAVVDSSVNAMELLEEWEAELTS